MKGLREDGGQSGDREYRMREIHCREGVSRM